MAALDVLNDWLWGRVLIVALLAIGLVLSARTRWVQFRYFGAMFALLGRAFQQEGNHLSSFQALVLSVAGRVGGGNIAGVAVAISLGGPGAVFWMWVTGLIGMATSFFECTIARCSKSPRWTAPIEAARRITSSAASACAGWACSFPCCCCSPSALVSMRCNRSRWPAPWPTPLAFHPPSVVRRSWWCWA